MIRKIKTPMIYSLCAALLAAIMLFGINALPEAEAAEREVTASGTYGEVTWTLYDDGELYIGGEGVIGSVANNSFIPWYTKASEITKITIGKDVVYGEDSELIKSNNYSALKEISVEEGNTSLSTDENGILFNYDKSTLILYPASGSLSEYSIPDTVTQLEDYSFYSSNLKKIVIGDSVTKIGWYALSDCDNLTDITLPKKINSMGRNAFSGCDALESVTVPQCTISISMFSDCKNLKTVVLPETLKAIGQNAFDGCENLSEISIPSSVTSIGRYAFRGCEKLETIEISSKVTKIEFFTFNGCTGLKKVVLGEGVTTVDYNAFGGCESIETVEVNSNISWENLSNVIKNSNSLKTIIINAENEYFSCDENGVLYNKDKTELLCYPSGKTDSAYTIPDNVKRIGATAFKDAAALKNITIPSSVEYIGANAFLDSGFYKDNANWDNGFLYIGTNLVAADSDAVAIQCRLYSKTTLVASRVFEKFEITSIIIPDGVKHINDYAFINCDNLASVTLPSGLVSLGTGAFYDCDSLKTIEIPAGVSEIGNFTFYGSDILENVILNEGLSSIGEKAFYSVPALTEIHIPSTVTSVDATAFEKSGVTDIYYGNSKAEWKRASGGAEFAGITVHYTLTNEDGTVSVVYTDDDVSWEAGNVEIANVVAEEVPVDSSSFVKGDFYVDSMVEPINIMNICMLDGDGNEIQPLEGQTVTVYIKAPDKVAEMFRNGIDRYFGEEKNVDFGSLSYKDGTVTFEADGKTVSAPVSDIFKNSLNIYHWFSEKFQNKNFMIYKSGDILIENGNIIIEVPHFSEFTIYTESISLDDAVVEVMNGQTVNLSTSCEEGFEIVYTSSDETVATVDKNGVITAKNPGTATITAVISGTDISDTCEVTVLAREFKIKWVIDGVETEQTLKEQSAIVPVNAPAKNGYVFVGWSPEVPDEMPAYDLTFTAVYKADTIKSIKVISLPDKTEYTYKTENLDITGLVLEVTYSNGAKETVTDTSQMNVTGFNNKQAGTQTLNVEYCGEYATFNVSVIYAWWQFIIRIFLLGIFWY